EILSENFGQNITDACRIQGIKDLTNMEKLLQKEDNNERNKILKNRNNFPNRPSNPQYVPNKNELSKPYRNSRFVGNENHRSFDNRNQWHPNPNNNPNFNRNVE